MVVRPTVFPHTINCRLEMYFVYFAFALFGPVSGTCLLYVLAIYNVASSLESMSLLLSFDMNSSEDQTIPISKISSEDREREDFEVGGRKIEPAVPLRRRNKIGKTCNEEESDCRPTLLRREMPDYKEEGTNKLPSQRRERGQTTRKRDQRAVESVDRGQTTRKKGPTSC